MAEKARERLGKAPNASVFVEDGQALSFADCSFDVILCNLGLMFFPDPVRGLSVVLVTASQMASASAASFFCRLT
jgi:ubiquinone/menaquinone biosynthesis C-methylase UbiE